MYLGVEVAALLHEGADGEPEAVGQGELVLDDLGPGRVAGMRVVPLVRAEPGDHEHRYRDEDVGGQRVQPDLDRQRVHEREEPGRMARRYLRDCAFAISLAGYFLVDARLFALALCSTRGKLLRGIVVIRVGGSFLIVSLLVTGKLRKLLICGAFIMIAEITRGYTNCL